MVLLTGNPPALCWPPLGYTVMLSVVVLLDFWVIHIEGNAVRIPCKLGNGFTTRTESFDRRYGVIGRVNQIMSK